MVLEPSQEEFHLHQTPPLPHPARPRPQLSLSLAPTTPYLRIWKSNWMVFFVSLRCGTVNRRPPQSCRTGREDKGAVRLRVCQIPIAALLPYPTALLRMGRSLSLGSSLLSQTYTGSRLHGVAQVTHQQAALVHSKVVTAQAGEVLEVGWVQVRLWCASGRISSQALPKSPPSPLGV